MWEECIVSSVMALDYSVSMYVFKRLNYFLVYEYLCPSGIHMVKPNPQGDSMKRGAFEKCWGHEHPSWIGLMPLEKALSEH